MKNLKNFGKFLGVLCLLASCSSDKVDEPNKNDNFNNLDGLYFSVNISVGNQTRTATGSEGEEAGQKGENEIYNVMLVFADGETGNYITKSETVEITGGQDISTNAVTRIFKVTATNMEAFKGIKSVKVYAICNHTTSETSFDEENVQQIMSLIPGDNQKYTDIYWNKATGLLMTNAEDVTINDEPENFSTDKNNPTNLGTIKVQRAIARFDIAKDLDAENTMEDVKVTFDAVALVNVSKTFFLFKEVEKTAGKSDFTILSEEISGLYVNDPKWKNYNKDLLEPTSFYYPLTKNYNASDFNFKSYSDLVKNENKPTGGSMGTDYNGNNNYYIFDYATPNTIIDHNKQLIGNTTGIVFRGELTAASGKSISGMSDGKTLYAYANVLYGDKDNLDKMVKEITNYNEDPLTLVAINKYMTDIEQDVKDNASSNEEVFNAAMVKAGFTVYKATQEESNNYHYYCYYYYWNRHDSEYNTPNDGQMGVMEFGVVRNNIYKLAVTKVSVLGHPANSADDPNPVDPSGSCDPKPDENAYFTVSVQVIPWSVRVNDIEF